MMVATGTDEVLDLLCSHVKLDRDRGVSLLEKLLSDKQHGLAANQEDLAAFEKCLVTLVESDGKSWETRHGGLLGAKLVIMAGIASDEFLETMKKDAVVLMHKDEFRERILAGNVI